MAERILLVDDDAEHLEMMRQCLYRMGLPATAVNGGDQALELLQGNSFEIVISDIQMPGTDGVGILRFIKAHAPDTDVILVTGFSDKYSFTDVIKEGATDYLAKPFVKDEIEAKIKRIFRERNEINRRKNIEVMLRKITEDLHHSHINLEEKVLQRTKDLHEAQNELISVFESVPDGIISIDNTMVLRHKNNQCMDELTVKTGEVFEPGTSKFQQECYKIFYSTINNNDPIKDYQLELHRGKNTYKVFQVSSTCLFRKNGAVKGALLVIRDITKVVVLESQLKDRRHLRPLISESWKMQEVYQRLRQVASVNTTIIITGESGVGKELIVDTLHSRGDRSSKPLIKVNCSALPENLLESELFGHVKGAFTGASQDRAGRIELAEGGILFLDEIGDISSRLQVKLLRFLEQKEYERVGESEKRTADVRIFAATNADLAEKIANGSFREDLYYRLKVMNIHLPPLRERREDIPLLVDYFLAFYNDKFNKKVSNISRDALDVLMAQQWRGNIRELKHACEHAFLLCQGKTLELNMFPREILVQKHDEPSSKFQLQPARTLTRESLLKALDDTHWHKTKTAQLLQISRATLYEKLKKFGLTQNNS